MLIGNKYKVESDSLNVTLYYKQKSRKGSITEKWRPFAYFSNSRDALKYLITIGVMETGLADLRTVVEKIDELHRLVDTLKGLPELQRTA